MKKNKLGDVLTAVCDMGELEREVRDNLKNGLPVMGFFKGKQMWSCFLFEKTEIPKGKISPAYINSESHIFILRWRSLPMI